MRIDRLTTFLTMLTANQRIALIDFFDWLEGAALDRLRQDINLWEKCWREYLDETKLSEGEFVTTEKIVDEWKELSRPN